MFQVGKFFGEVEPTLMNELTIDDSSDKTDPLFPYQSKRGVFKRWVPSHVIGDVVLSSMTSHHLLALRYSPSSSHCSVDIYDYQGLCEIWKRSSSAGYSFMFDVSIHGVLVHVVVAEYSFITSFNYSYSDSIRIATWTCIAVTLFVMSTSRCVLSEVSSPASPGFYMSSLCKFSQISSFPYKE